MNPNVKSIFQHLKQHCPEYTVVVERMEGGRVLGSHQANVTSGLILSGAVMSGSIAGPRPKKTDLWEDFIKVTYYGHTYRILFTDIFIHCNDDNNTINSWEFGDPTFDISQVIAFISRQFIRDREMDFKLSLDQALEVENHHKELVQKLKDEINKWDLDTVASQLLYYGVVIAILALFTWGLYYVNGWGIYGPEYSHMKEQEKIKALKEEITQKEKIEDQIKDLLKK